jgi:hypothetical protein
MQEPHGLVPARRRRRETATFPQLGRTAYAAVRRAFRAQMPDRVTPEWILEFVPGYSKRRSALELRRTLRVLGLVNEEHQPTALMYRWLNDRMLAHAAREIIYTRYDLGLQRMAERGQCSVSEVRQWMVENGAVSPRTAANAANLFAMLADQAAPSGFRTPEGDLVEDDTGRNQARMEDEVTDVNREAVISGSPVGRIEYLIGPGRMAVVELPTRVTAEEIDRLVKKLQEDRDLLAFHSTLGG